MLLLCCLVLLSCDLPHVGSSLASTDSGPSLLIPLELQTLEPPFLVVWMKGRMLLGRTRRGQCTYGCNEKSSVFSNGSLFLSQVQREDEGTYVADVFNASGILIHHSEIGLQVVDVSSDHMIDLTLENGSLGHPQEAVWSKGEENLGRVHMGMCDLGCSERPRVFSNGSLFLRRVQKADQGLYSALVHDPSRTSTHHIHVILYVNEIEATSGRNLSVSAVIFIGMMTVFCLSVITFVVLGRFLSNRSSKENRGDSEEPSHTVTPEVIYNSQVEMHELGVHEENVYEVEALSTFQCKEAYQ
ncbi:uncharacterized protein LOC120994307 [Bufo bufo]|uniref:uncharacterized protein LOC120994307 n=1 Tax=Bufo bufo TaxID=8384 RepID=UPI001ABE2ACF|nr:uncharacterized protein LOC120994307 [Bufo bufo]